MWVLLTPKGVCKARLTAAKDDYWRDRGAVGRRRRVADDRSRRLK